jgi:sulfatase maturation enzyme AslB (radical SAM superfamily)
MAKLVTVEAHNPKVDPEELIYVRYGELGDGYIVTSESGSWHFFNPEDFETYLAGKVPLEDDLSAELTQKGFIRQGYDVEYHARKFRGLKRFLGAGVSRHYVSLNGEDGELATDTAKAIVDQVVTCASDTLNVTFIDNGAGIRTGILEFFKDYAKEKNQYEGKELNFAVRSPLETFGEEEASWLIKNKFALETHLDGSESVHNAGRPSTGAGEYSKVIEGIRVYLEAGKSAQKERHQISLTITTRLSPEVSGADTVQSFQANGVREFRVLPIVGTEMNVDTYLTCYASLLDALMKVESGTPRVRELGVSHLLQRIHREVEVDDILMQSPSGAGLSELSYDVNGNIFPSEEARALFEEGDSMFHLGKAGEVDPKEVRKSHTVRALTIASIVDCLPGYQTLWSAPYLGLDPVHSYVESGDLFPCLLRDSRSQARHGLVSAVFEMLIAQEGDKDAVFMQLAGSGDDGI